MDTGERIGEERIEERRGGKEEEEEEEENMENQR